MKAALKAFGAVAVCAAVFGFGAAAAAYRGWLQPLATIQIDNRSGQQLRLLEVKHESRGVSSIATLPALSAGQSFSFRFFVAGEGGYRINAVLADGTVPKDSEGYVESGYNNTEVITPTAIVPSSFASGAN
jgi:hypothetical protein